MLCLIEVLQNDAGVQSTALVDAVSVHLVEQGPEAHAEPFGGLAAVSRRPGQGGGDGLALRELHCVTEGTAPRSLLPPVGAGSGERFLPKIRRLQDLLVAQY